MKCKFYEELKCPDLSSKDICDCNDECIEYYIASMNRRKVEIAELKGKLSQAESVARLQRNQLHRRNMQIKDLKITLRVEEELKKRFIKKHISRQESIKKAWQYAMEYSQAVSGIGMNTAEEKYRDLLR